MGISGKFGVILTCSKGCSGAGVSATYRADFTLLYLPQSFFDCVDDTEEDDDVYHGLLFLWECLDLLDFLFLCEFDGFDLEDDEEDDLCLLFFLNLCPLLDWSLRDGLVCEVCLSFDLQVLGGSTITLRSDICEKSGSSGNIILMDMAGYGNSCANVCSETML